MARVAIPYEVDHSDDVRYVVGAPPTKATRTVHGDEYEKGLSFVGDRGTVLVPIAPVHAGPLSKSTPFVQPSTVAPDGIKPALYATFNLYSPVSHPNFRYEFSKTLPAPAQTPNTKLPGVNHFSRRASGDGNTPYPFATFSWLTDSMQANQI